MGVRWFTTVIDCRDIKAQSQWWATVLGWKVGVMGSCVDWKINYMPSLHLLDQA